MGCVLGGGSKWVHLQLLQGHTLSNLLLHIPLPLKLVNSLEETEQKSNGWLEEQMPELPYWKVFAGGQLKFSSHAKLYQSSCLRFSRQISVCNIIRVPQDCWSIGSKESVTPISLVWILKSMEWETCPGLLKELEPEAIPDTEPNSCSSLLIQLIHVLDEHTANPRTSGTYWVMPFLPQPSTSIPNPIRQVWNSGEDSGSRFPRARGNLVVSMAAMAISKLLGSSVIPVVRRMDSDNCLDANQVNLKLTSFGQVT